MGVAWSYQLYGEVYDTFWFASSDSKVFHSDEVITLKCQNPILIHKNSVNPVKLKYWGLDFWQFC